MDAQLIETIKAAVEQGLTFRTLALMLAVSVGSGLAAFLGAYFRKRGEHRAQEAAFANVLIQVQRQTEAVEGIKTRFAEEVSYRKKRGEFLAQEDLFDRLLSQLKDQTVAVEGIKKVFAEELASHQAGLTKGIQIATAIMLPQLDAYRRLWEMTFVVRPTREHPITEAEKTRLLEDMTKWYYDAGNGIFLTLESGERWRTARSSLSNGNDDGQINDAFSGLRTQLKFDISVYGPIDAQTDLGT